MKIMPLLPREFDSYLAEPPAMASGASGKCGELSLGFELDERGVTVLRTLERRAPLIVQQPLYFDRMLPNMACVYILSSGAANIDGDRYRQQIRLGAGSMAYISTGAATKIATMRYNHSSLSQSFRLEEESYLEYLPEPVIPHSHSRYHVDSSISISPSATLFMGESYLSGRRYHHDERFEYDILSLRLSVEDLEHKPLYREHQILQPLIRSPRLCGVMGRYEVFSNLLILSPHIRKIRSLIKPCHTPQLALGVLSLPDNKGLSLRVLSSSSQEAKRTLRRLCSLVREVVKGVQMPPEFVWK